MEIKRLKIRKVEEADRATYTELVHEFYHSEAVIAPVPAENVTRMFNELMRSDDYAEAYLAEYDGAPAGFVLLAKTFSQEAGGMVLWLEELYIRSTYRGMGIGSQFFSFLCDHYGDRVKRIRLEVDVENEDARRLYYRWGFEDFPYEQMLLE